MKATFFCIIAFFCASLLSHSQTTQQGKYFFTRSGHIEYTFGGNAKGTKTVWFDDYGMKMSTLTESSTTVTLAGFTNTTKEKKLEIRKGKEVWIADLLNNTGTRTDIAVQTDLGEGLTQGKSDAELHQVERKMITDLGGKISGYETLVGKKCLVFTWGNNKFFQYKGIPLKSELAEMGVELTETAVLFEENIPVPAVRFEIPAGIDFQKAESLSGMLGQMEGLEGFNLEEEPESAPGLSFTKFRDATKNLNIPGYEFFMDSDNRDLYMTSFVKSETDQVVFFAENESRFESFLTLGENYLVKSRYTLNGREAAFLHVLKDEDGNQLDSRMLLVRVPEYKTLLYIVSAMPFSQKELEGFFGQIDL